MDEREASDLVEAELRGYRDRSADELIAMVGHITHYRVEGPSGATYNVEIQVFFDSPGRKDNVRVMGSIDDGARGHFGIVRPMSRSFIVRPDGTFIGES